MASAICCGISNKKLHDMTLSCIISNSLLVTTDYICRYYYAIENFTLITGSVSHISFGKSIMQLNMHYYTCTIHACTLYIHYTYTIHALYMHYTYTIHTLYIHYTYTIHTLYIHYTYTIHTLYIHYTYTIHALYMHYTCTIHACTLYMHYTYTIHTQHLQ